MKRTTYFSKEIEESINIDADSTESFSGRVGFMIGSAAKVAAEECPPLPVGVWCALADANNGTFFNYEAGPEFVVSGMAHNLFDLGEDNQFGIDAHEWAAKIQKMPFSQRLAVFEVVRRFWSSPEIVNASSGYVDAWTKLGANVSKEQS